MNIGQSPVSEQYFNGQMTPAQLLGINPAGSSAYKPAGHALRGSSAGAGDAPMTWWSPSSPAFWVIAAIVVTVTGMAGADARVRLGRRSLSASVG